MARIKINKEDTAEGRLGSFNDFSTPVYKRVAHVASRQAKSQGLSRSTIAIGAGHAGVMDQAADIAKADANNSIQAKIAQAQNETTLSAARIDADSAMARQLAADKAASERLASQLESQEGQAAEERSLKDKLAGEQRDLDKYINETRIASEENQNIARITSSENIATADREAQNDRANLAAQVEREGIASREEQSVLDRENSILLQNLDDESNERMEQAKIDYQNTKDVNDRKDAAWDGLQNGINSIDVNASSSSQSTQFNRLMEVYESRVAFINAATGGEADAPPEQTAYYPGTQIPMLTGKSLADAVKSYSGGRMGLFSQGRA